MEIIVADNITKVYQIYERFSHRVAEWALLDSVKLHKELYALSNVSFKVGAGEAFGVIGENGAGKSTLLKIMAGISLPTSGEFAVKGSMATLLDIGAGFKPQFTGRENILLNSALMGISGEEAEAKSEEIIEFAELGDYIEHRFFTYSTGMAMRLGFAIAISADADIFLVDEVIAVGDEYFQRKCINKIERMLGDGKTIVLVSHNLHAVRNMCSRALWLEGGKTRRLDRAEDVVDEYVAESRRKKFRGMAAEAEGEGASKNKAAAQERGQGATVVGVALNGIEDPSKWSFKSGEPLEIAVTFVADIEIENPIMGVAIFRDDGVYVFGPNTKYDDCLKGVYKGVYTYSLVLDKLELLRGAYYITIGIYDKEHIHHYVWLDREYSFTVNDETHYYGLVNMSHSWKIEKKSP